MMTVKGSDFSFKISSDIDRAVSAVAFNLINDIVYDDEEYSPEQKLMKIEGVLELADQIHNIIEDETCKKEKE